MVLNADVLVYVNSNLSLLSYFTGTSTCYYFDLLCQIISMQWLSVRPLLSPLRNSYLSILCHSYLLSSCNSNSFCSLSLSCSFPSPPSFSSLLPNHQGLSSAGRASPSVLSTICVSLCLITVSIKYGVFPNIY